MRPALSLAPALLALALAGACGDSDPAGATDDVAAATDTSAVPDAASPEDTAAPDDDAAPPSDTASASDTAAAADVPAVEPAHPACVYPFDAHVTYVSDLAIGSLAPTSTAGAPDDHCCYDFDNDGFADNRLGEIIKLVQGLPQVDADLNELIAANVVNGAVTVLLELVGLDLDSAFSDVTLNAFYGYDTDDDHANNTAGTGTFTARLTSFEPGSATPAITFPGASVVNGNLYAGPSVFHLEVPLGDGLAISADITSARLEGTIAPGPHGGVALDGPTPDGIGGTRGARLGGLIHEDELYGALNTFVEGLCGCLSLPASTPLIRKVDGTWRCAAPIDDSACDADDRADAACATLANICDLALVFITPDITVGGGAGPANAFSVGLWLKGTGAELVGVEPTVCAP